MDLSVSALVGGSADRAGDADLLSLLQEFRAILAAFAPDLDLEIIRARVGIVLGFLPIHRNGEAADVNACCRGPELRVLDQIADNCQLIDKSFLLFFSRSLISPASSSIEN